MPSFPLVETPGELALTIPQGSTWSQRFVWGYYADPDNPDAAAVLASFTPYDLAGALVRCQVRPDRGSSKLIISLRTDNDRIIWDVGNDGTNGAFTLFLNAAETAAIKADVFRYDIEVVNEDYATPIVARPFGGDWTVDGEVTTTDD